MAAALGAVAVVVGEGTGALDVSAPSEHPARRAVIAITTAIQASER